MAALSIVSVALMVAAARAQPPTASVRITQKHLTVLCLDGNAVKPGERRWTLAAGDHVVTATMKNEPRPGMASTEPGFATIRFAVEPSHRYEMEVRAPAASFSTRVWKPGEWTPVVRDRSANAIVSSDPQWTAGSCKGPS